MCHGYYDPHVLMREVRDRYPVRDPVAAPEPEKVRPTPQGGLVALARRLVDRLRHPDTVPAE